MILRIAFFILLIFTIPACSMQMEIGGKADMKELAGVVDLERRKLDEVVTYLKQKEAIEKNATAKPQAEQPTAEKK